MNANLKQPKKGGRTSVIHAPINQKMLSTVCSVTVGRSWTVTDKPVDCPFCQKVMKERTL